MARSTRWATERNRYRGSRASRGWHLADEFEVTALEGKSCVTTAVRSISSLITIAVAICSIARGPATRTLAAQKAQIDIGIDERVKAVSRSRLEILKI